MKLPRKITAIFDRGISVFAFLAATILVFLWALTSTEVIVRFLVNYSILWAVKISEVLIFMATFLSAAWLLKQEAHIKVDLVYVHLKPRAQVLLDIIMSIIGIVVCLIIIWYGTKVTIDHFQRGIVSYDVLRMKVWPRYAIIILGCLLLVIQFCRRTYGKLILWRMPEGKEVAPREEKSEY